MLPEERAPTPHPIDRRSILGLAWPVVATNLLTTAVSWVDLIMVSQLGKETVAAVGLAGFLQTLLWALFMSVQIGASIVVAQAYGAGDRRGAELGLGQALLVGGGLSVPLAAVLFVPGRGPLVAAFRAFDAEPAVAAIGSEYLHVVLLAIPALMLSLVCQGALRAAGDTRTPLWLTGTGNLLNVSLNYLLIFGHFGFPELGAVGAAWGTVLARSVEALLYVTLLSSDRLRLRLRARNLLVSPPQIRELVRLGTPAAIEQFVINLGFLIYNRAIASYGTDALAAYQVGVILLQAAFMPGFGFSVAATTLVGQWVGAGDPETARLAGRRCRTLAVALMSVLGALFFVAARPFARAIIDDDGVVDIATQFIQLLALSQPAMAVHFAMSGALRGAADTKSPLLAAILAMYGVRLPFSLAGAFLFQAPVLLAFLGMLGAHHVRAGVLMWRWRRGTFEAYQRPQA